MMNKGKGAGNLLFAFNEKQDPYFSEQIRVLRARFEKRADSQQCKIIAVTSAVAGEGKTMSSVTLASSLAQDSGKKVLLLDMDFRNSELAKGLNVTTKSGLSEFLSDKVPLIDVMQNSYERNLHIIPSGGRITNPSNLFTGDSLKKFLAEVRERYDCIIVDAPPVVPVSDALNLRDHVDGFLIVVRFGFVPVNILRQAIEDVGESLILGVIFNGVPMEKHSYYKRYYGKYYSPPAKK